MDDYEFFMLSISYGKALNCEARGLRFEAPRRREIKMSFNSFEL